MRRIGIIGRSCTHQTLITEIRRHDPEAEVLVFMSEAEGLYTEAGLTEVISGKKDWPEIAVLPVDFYDKARVQVVTAKITRLNINRRRVITEDKRSYDFDACIFAQLGDLPPEAIKGAHRQGVFLLGQALAGRQALKDIPLADTLFIQARGLRGLRIVAALLHFGKEIFWVTPEERVLSDVLQEETGDILTRILEDAGVRVLTASAIESVLGDQDMRAVRLTNGKVYGGQILFLEPDRADLRLLKDANVPKAQGLCPAEGEDGSFAPGCFAVDSAADTVWQQHLFDWNNAVEVLEDQARRVIATVFQADDEIRSVPLQARITWGEQDLFAVGRGQDGEDLSCHVVQDQQTRSCSQLVLKEDVLVQAVLLNNPQQVPLVFEKWAMGSALEEKDKLALGLDANPQIHIQQFLQEQEDPGEELLTPPPGPGINRMRFSAEGPLTDEHPGG